MLDDTIVALATPLGESGVAVVRLSGAQALVYAGRLFKPQKAQDMAKKAGHTLTLGWLTDETGAVIDQILLAVMRAPHSYTGEDVAEFHCHGGMYAVRACIRLCLQQGARLAEAGEFTQRAFLHDKVDLTQAEAIIDIIQARSERGLKIAADQLQGRLRQQVEALEDRLTELGALLIASLDFPEDVGDFDQDYAQQSLRCMQLQTEALLQAAARNAIYRDGVKMVICGKPNVGKSSLLNYLADREKAIITDIPGTTRDIVEADIYIQGVPVNLLDTAGLRATDDLVERLGMEKTRAALETADVILFMADGAGGVTPEDEQAFAAVAPYAERALLLINKADVMTVDLADAEMSFALPLRERSLISVKTGQGLAELLALLAVKLTGSAAPDNLGVAINLRQQQALERYRDKIVQLLTLLPDAELDCLAVDLQEAADILGELSGKNLAEDSIERIFREFCVGK
jgi:tRNA modification GTPase